MKHVNKCIFLGNAGDVPKALTTPTGVAMATVGLATNRYTKGEGKDWNTHTSWHNLLFFDEKATKALETIKKGDILYVEGELRYNTFDNKDGIRVTKAEIRVFDYTVIPKGITSNDTAPIQKASLPEVETDEVPF